MDWEWAKLWLLGWFFTAGLFDLHFLGEYIACFCTWPFMLGQYINERWGK